MLFLLNESIRHFKLKENSISNYSFQDYEKDILNSLFYIPFFTAVWFGSLSYDELIDKNWPYFFIQKYAYLLDEVIDIQI